MHTVTACLTIAGHQFVRRSDRSGLYCRKINLETRSLCLSFPFDTRVRQTAGRCVSSHAFPKLPTHGGRKHTLLTLERHGPLRMCTAHGVREGAVDPLVDKTIRVRWVNDVLVRSQSAIHEVWQGAV